MWTYYMVLWAVGNKTRAAFAMQSVAANALEVMAFEAVSQAVEGTK